MSKRLLVLVSLVITASMLLAVITSDTKTNKRLDISYSSEYWFEIRTTHIQCGV